MAQQYKAMQASNVGGPAAGAGGAGAGGAGTGAGTGAAAAGQRKRSKGGIRRLFGRYVREDDAWGGGREERREGNVGEKDGEARIPTDVSLYVTAHNIM